MRWGLLPSFVKDPKRFPTLINARSEDALEKPSFRNAMRYRRCLVPANGFYEWTGRRASAGLSSFARATGGWSPSPASTSAGAIAGAMRSTPSPF